MHTSTLKPPEKQVQEEFEVLDLNKYAGTWHVIAAITTPFDRNWNNISETYALNNEGYIDVYTSFTRKDKLKVHHIKARAFPEKESHYYKWKVKILRLIKSDYLIEELAPDYSYTVVGHPKKIFLYIMCREKSMDGQSLYEIINRCRGRGYNITKLRKINQSI